MSTHEDRTGSEIAKFERPRLPYHPAFKERFDIEPYAWKALAEAVFPLAKTADSIALALSYCRARKLDPFKRVVHIVPMWDSGKNAYVDTIWPSIAELRITAHRTREYVGCDEIEFGPEKTATFKGRTKVKNEWQDTIKKVTFPEWAKATVYRHQNGITGKYVARVKWLEAYATIGNTELPNDMWEFRAEGQLGKCAEAAALRMAFPEEIGNEYAAEEMHGRTITQDVRAAEAQIQQIASATAKKRPRTLAEVAEQFDTDPNPDHGKAEPPQPGGHGQAQPPEDDVSSLTIASGGASVPAEDQAYARGHEAHRRGDALNTVPKEYRGNKALTAAWKEGWQAAKEEAEADGSIDE